MLKTFGSKENFVNTFQDPFKSNKIRKVEFIVEQDIWNKGAITYTSTIYFKSNDTSGYHTVKAGSFIELVQATETFIDNL